nr:hypothetical protein [Actinomycetota bacterium]
TQWKFYPQFYVPFDLDYYTHHATLGQPTVFWKRSVRDRFGDFDMSYRLLGDCEYWLRAARNGATFNHLDEILAVQVEHEGTLRNNHPQLLQEEFFRLRSHYDPGGPKQGRRYASLERKIRWRWYQAQFILGGGAKSRWPRFMEFVASHEIEMKRSGLLWYMLPLALRGDRASLLDADQLVRNLMPTPTEQDEPA